MCVSTGTSMPCHDTHVHIHVKGRVKDNFRNLFLSSIKESRDQAQVIRFAQMASPAGRPALLSGRLTSPFFTAVHVATGKGKITCVTHVTSLLDSAAPSL